MTGSNKQDLLKQPEYQFVKTDPRLKHIILLAFGGSHAYGTDIPESDIDIRGVALNSKQEVLLGQDFHQISEPITDTVIYSFNAIIQLLTACNPNTIEILGCHPDDYLYLSDIGKELLKNKNMFLSKRCIHTFIGYANGQLHRLNNKSARKYTLSQKEEHILKTLMQAEYAIKPRYQDYESNIRLYIDKAINPDLETEIFMDVNLKHYPLRDYLNLWSELSNIRKSFDKLGKRNKVAISHDKLNKHMMHLLRLYIMGIDILTKQEIITYRKNEHDLLMAIRNHEFLDDNGSPTKEFHKILKDYQARFDRAVEITTLPDTPDIQAIQAFQSYINERIVTDDIL